MRLRTTRLLVVQDALRMAGEGDGPETKEDRLPGRGDVEMVKELREKDQRDPRGEDGTVDRT